MKILYILLIEILMFVGGYAFGFTNAPEPVTPQIKYIYYLDQERIDSYERLLRRAESRLEVSHLHIEVLQGLIEGHEEELNRRGKTIMKMEQKMGEMGFKISVYKAMTGKEIEVWSGSSK